MRLESLQNPRIKNLQKLQTKSRERKVQNLFVVEGIQENQMAMERGFEAVEFYICPEIFKDALKLPIQNFFEVSPTLFEKIAYRGTTEGIIGLYKSRTQKLEEIQLPSQALIVVLEAVEKPGNLGAVLRTCDAAGVDLLLVCDALTDFYNPNVIRSSVGTVFTNQIAADSKEKVLNWLKTNGVQVVSTFLRDDTLSLYEVDFKPSTALILGTEAVGLSDFWVENSDKFIKIPMKGRVDSLNVSNAAAICIYEAVRQKEI